jgi:hypothetical protein
MHSLTIFCSTLNKINTRFLGQAKSTLTLGNKITQRSYRLLEIGIFCLVFFPIMSIDISTVQEFILIITS